MGTYQVINGPGGGGGGTAAGPSFYYINAAGPPANGVGIDGDTCIDPTGAVFGPKASGAWPATPQSQIGSSGGVNNYGALGANDAASRGTFYFIEDFLKNLALPEVTIQTFGTSNAVTPIGTSTSLPNLTPADYGQHPGLYQITSVNKNGGATGCSNMALCEGSVNGVGGLGLTYTWFMTFKTPAQLSNATDQYVIAIGTSKTSSSDALNVGMGIRYCDDTNGGNWTLYSVNPGGSYNPTNTSVACQAATWYTLIIQATGGTNTSNAKFTFNLNGTALGTFSDAQWGPSYTWGLSQGGYSIARKAAGATPATITGYLDRLAMYIPGLGR